MTVVDIQLSPANTERATPTQAAALAEDLGYRAMFMFDHLGGEPLCGSTMLECFTTPPPTRIVGVNSERLSRIAGQHADGINVPWRHPRRDQFLAAANEAAGDRPFLRTAYTTYHRDLLDPGHPDRLATMDRRIDRLVLAVFDSLDEWISEAARP